MDLTPSFLCVLLYLITALYRWIPSQKYTEDTYNCWQQLTPSFLYTTYRHHCCILLSAIELHTSDTHPSDVPNNHCSCMLLNYITVVYHRPPTLLYTTDTDHCCVALTTFAALYLWPPTQLYTTDPLWSWIPLTQTLLYSSYPLSVVYHWTQSQLCTTEPHCS
jgi:hypothetical protein